ncbi:MAG: EAL domain-containing protein [Gammaproteobacteria bacterium]|nr:EAL domain-containing protein [Gammaproteobacteria bacterium]NNJ50530.1 EAL domain-containing protein [Gammaproteobacteria bacterium]
MSNVVSLFSDTQKYEERPVVVLADDDPSIRLMVRHVLESEDFDIIEASDGLEAIKAVEKHHPALILLDAVMPGIDGFTTCQQIKDKGHTDIPVMMITGLDDDASVERAYEVGAIDFITKPIKWAVLKHRVKSVVAKVIAERKVKLLAYRDTLTSLPNRLLFADRLEQAVVRSERSRTSMALMLIDIDDFKLVNDSFGHDAGDKLIKAVGDLISKSLRRADTIARLGGDEFAVIIEGIDGPDDAISIADNLTTILEHNVRLDDQETYTSASIGIAVYPGDGRDARTLLKNADTAMYRAKESGRHCFQFYKPEMSVSAMERLDLENSLKAAFENDEFLIHYQPVVDIHKNEVVGVEALLRWQHPEKGMIQPSDFVNVVEDCGLIVALGEWMVHSVCKQVKLWHDAGLEKQNVSINLSPRQFKEQDLVTLFTQALAENGIDGSSLSVEVTERTLIDNVGEVEKTLKKLRGMGLRILLDDFGTGYASLAYLKEFPVDVVKIDHAFIAGIPDNQDDSAIVDAIAGLTRGLKLALHAEGVENERQLNVLKGLGCQFGQGYYWSKPLPGNEYEQFYMNQIYNIG